MRYLLELLHCLVLHGSVVLHESLRDGLDFDGRSHGLLG